MTAQLVPAEILKKADKVLFIAHLALGDFTYLQNCFQAFAQAFPHIKIHIWVDEVRRTKKTAAWPYLKKYALYDWLAECPFVAKIYQQTYSPALFEQSIVEAQEQHYPLVVSLSTLRPPMYATLARQISPQGFVAGMKKPAGMLALHKHLAYRKLDAAFDPDRVAPSRVHISDVYAAWFNRLFGMDSTSSARLPFVRIPEQWGRYAQEQLKQWGFERDRRQSVNPAKLVFINPYAKTRKRCWPLERVVELVTALRAQEAWKDTRFIVNVVPEEMAQAKIFFDGHALQRLQLFSAQENFFQLPAMLRECDLIISVETAVMHLANAVQVPVIALMRQKNPEWAPIDKENSRIITTAHRRDWVKAITVAQVIAVLNQK
ncbi:glycosyltransferase family 9 protein [Collimonas sp.]|jgi:heptosyltransferase-3|uniref:glycosyltransferase family 9 protein n=1 Tax=Collimonas sp. TaxID=1963772 RepID=UPI002D1B652B|nr:glycosyltransferase family 9 protein [Collimonas sp.]HWW08114.1 glycosyltransferase family 9 protein [Collimonas sp.]